MQGFSVFQVAAAQKYAYEKAEIYLLKSDFTSAKDINEASYILQISKYSDTAYICRYYNKFGPMLKQESFLDSNLSIPNGIFGWYDMKGNLDSMAKVYRVKKTSWAVYDDSLKTVLSVRTRNGNVFEKRDYLLNMYTDSAGNIRNLAEKEKEDRDKYVNDSITKNQKEAIFPAGTKKWLRYISDHVFPPDRLVKSMPPGVYTVIVSFVVTKEGKVDEVYLVRSCEWSADLEVFKTIENSPPWQPAMQNGRNVTYRQKQNITFEVTRD